MPRLADGCLPAVEPRADDTSRADEACGDDEVERNLYHFAFVS